MANTPEPNPFIFPEFSFIFMFFSFLIEIVLEISYGPLLTEEEKHRKTIAACTIAVGDVLFPFAQNTKRSIFAMVAAKGGRERKSKMRGKRAEHGTVFVVQQCHRMHRDPTGFSVNRQRWHAWCWAKAHSATKYTTPVTMCKANNIASGAKIN